MTPSVLFGKVMHRRLFPKVNGFQYGIYYMALPLSVFGSLPITRNKLSVLSVRARDHGPKDGSSLMAWARNILNAHGLGAADGEIVLLTMPRVFGYVFNPVSFWLCYDKNNSIRAVLCEVNNTFGETHTYVCAHPDAQTIKATDTLSGQKVFHVSPFLERAGHYEFRFDIRDEACGIWINFFDALGQKKLVTSVIGKLAPLNKSSQRKAFLGYPLITLKAILLIHWQALKIVLKGIKYIPKPTQKQEKITTKQ